MSQFLPWLYVLRTPLVFGFLLAGLAPVSLWSPARGLLEGLFDVPGLSVFFATIAAFFVAAACTFSAWLVLQYGDVRFGVPKRHGATTRKQKSPVPGFTIDALGWVLAIFFNLAAMSVALGIAIKVKSVHGSYPFMETLGGIAVFGGIVLLAKWLWAVSPIEGERLAALFEFTSPGYSVLVRGKRQLEKGHGFALSVALLSYALYFVLGYPWSPMPSALVCVLLLMAMLCWNFSALAFFFDRFRTPVFLPLLVLAVGAAQWPDSDHFFKVVHQSTEQEPARPFALLNASAGGNASDAAIVICASGGGIQAAAWTAQVLTALRAEMGPKFTQSLRLVSTVSGGSAGALPFLAAWENGDVQKDRLESIVDAASDGSLDDVARGLIYPDFWKSVLPFLIRHDWGRGQAMENAWTRNASAHKIKLPDSFSGWRAEAASGTRPVVIFNATVVETGERLMMSTSDFEPASSDVRGRMRTFGELFSSTGLHLDLAPVTAARLSSTFPYVSPAARADADLPQNARYHIVDGGYYDNWGVASAMEFLEQAVLKRPAARVKRILFIQIRDRLTDSGPKVASGNRGAFFQFLAPIMTLFTVQSSAQVSHDQTELRIFREAARAAGIDVQPVDFEFPIRETPLSWYLDNNQRDKIRREWSTHYQRSPEICQVRKFLNLDPGEVCRP